VSGTWANVLLHTSLAQWSAAYGPHRRFVRAITAKQQMCQRFFCLQYRNESRPN